ncbi:MAG: helix-turn-helix transcriptional regulator [Deltaproteobacteria bacterium]|nr:helix-turn-helix transcriptional regulator [Deltaproteobacteria bacterium]MBW2071062.1 helix-turn-helix transcriptional regulator [Deltaproteobacteria bacterium]
MTAGNDQEKIGERLQRFREIRGITRTVLAQKLGMTETDLVEVEAGRKPLSKKSVETLREVFSLDPGWLFGGKHSF